MRGALTNEQKQEIRLLSASGKYSYRELAKKYFVSISTINYIINKGDKIDTRKFKGYYRKPDRNRTHMRKKFDRKEVVTNLIDAISEYSLMDNWTELYLMEMLLSCGLTKDDFELTGYLDFYKEYFEEKEMAI